MGVVAVVLLVAAVGAWMGLPRQATPPSSSAAASPTATPSGAPATPTAAPSEGTSSEPSGAASEAAPQPSFGQDSLGFRELSKQVAAIRDLPLRRRVRARVVGPQALADKISDLGFAETDRREAEADERLLVALRLAPADLDLPGLLEELYREQVRGVYVPKEKTFYVGGEADELGPAGRVTAAHEITHALQDQSFDLQRLRRAVEDNDDASLALLALIEGDAVLTGQLWTAAHLDDTAQAQAQLESAGGGSALERAPQYLRNALFFPYLRGAAFVAQLRASGGNDAVDAAFQRPPETTEQILHPEAYSDDEPALDVSVAGRPGDGWTASQTYDFGEFDLVELFAGLGQDTSAEVGAGWGGGQVRSWRRGPDTAVGLALTFDTAADAGEACEALPQWYAEVAGGRVAGDGLLDGDRDLLAYTCDTASVRLGLAPDATTARRLAGIR
ncbi:MAG: hypothetical protein H0T98_05265 [Euzebyaceae bacterium]|nr:hypothetical protein [Euzebyaceae bacterium]